jgi:hypothetical protein
LFNYHTFHFGITKLIFMQDLIQRLVAKGLTTEQAYAAIEVIKTFTKEKFPVFGGAIDKLFDKYDARPADDFLE